MRVLGLRVLGLRVLGLFVFGLRVLGLRVLGLRVLGLRVLGLHLVNPRLERVRKGGDGAVEHSRQTIKRALHVAQQLGHQHGLGRQRCQASHFGRIHGRTAGDHRAVDPQCAVCVGGVGDRFGDGGGVIVAKGDSRLAGDDIL